MESKSNYLCAGIFPMLNHFVSTDYCGLLRSTAGYWSTAVYYGDDWNYGPKPIYWGKQAQSRFPPLPGAVVEPTRVLEFLRIREGPDGRSISEHLRSESIHVLVDISCGCFLEASEANWIE